MAALLALLLCEPTVDLRIWAATIRTQPSEDLSGGVAHQVQTQKQEHGRRALLFLHTQVQAVPALRIVLLLDRIVI